MGGGYVGGSGGKCLRCVRETFAPRCIHGTSAHIFRKRPAGSDHIAWHLALVRPPLHSR